MNYLSEQLKQVDLTELKKLTELIHTNAKQKGFYDSVNDLHFINSQLFECSKELAEASEGYKQGKLADSDIVKGMNRCLDKSEYWKNDFEAKIKDSVGDELADTLIRILDLSYHLEIPIIEHIRAKCHYNFEFREKLHGKRF